MFFKSLCEGNNIFVLIKTAIMPFKIVIAEDHPIVIDGIKLLFAQSTDYEVVGEANNEKEIISVCHNIQPDFLVLDLNLGGKNSTDLIPEIKNRFPKLKILIFSSYQTSVLIKKALSLGVEGYLLKDATKKDWLEALASLVEDKIYLSKSIRHFHEESTFDMDKFSQIAHLSEQERRIINLIINGLEEKEIAENLFISKHTVHTHKKNILRKLNLHTNTDLVKFAYENNLV
jgi:DNA-binding NarL/FixJ family response regulator